MTRSLEDDQPPANVLQLADFIDPDHDLLIQLKTEDNPTMADRFPSLEEFGEGQTSPKGAPGVDGPDADSDFLTRERAALGDDAAQFASVNDNAATVEDGDDDLLGGGGGGDYQPSGAGGEEIMEFESSFPAVDTRNDQMTPGGTITGSTLPFQSGMNQTQPSYGAFGGEPEEEPEPIRLWREKRDADRTKRAEIAENKKQERVKNAQQWVDDFYENYNSKKDKSTTKTRKDADEFLANREDTSAGGTSWERIAKLVDLSGKGAKGGATGTGKEQFRELLNGLRKDEKAPGASGY